MSDRDHYLPDRETVLSRSLSAQMREEDLAVDDLRDELAKGGEGG